MSSSDNLKKICEENGILLKDIITSFSLMSGHINEYSLWAIIDQMIYPLQSLNLHVYGGDVSVSPSAAQQTTVHCVLLPA